MPIPYVVVGVGVGAGDETLLEVDVDKEEEDDAEVAPVGHTTTFMVASWPRVLYCAPPMMRSTYERYATPGVICEAGT